MRQYEVERVYLWTQWGFFFSKGEGYSNGINRHKKWNNKNINKNGILRINSRASLLSAIKLQKCKGQSKWWIYLYSRAFESTWVKSKQNCDFINFFLILSFFSFVWENLISHFVSFLLFIFFFYFLSTSFPSILVLYWTRWTFPS